MLFHRCLDVAVSSDRLSQGNTDGHVFESAGPLPLEIVAAEPAGVALEEGHGHFLGHGAAVVEPQIHCVLLFEVVIEINKFARPIVIRRRLAGNEAFPDR
jgi:hypothetical protein